MEIDFNELKREFPYELDADLQYIETLDHGSFGTVIHAFDMSTNQDIAVKVIDKIGIRLSRIEKMKEEISILRILNHPNIVKFYSYTETTNQLLIKMEYIKYGSLKHWIQERNTITEEEASIILKKILSAIEYLHSKQICHRDIKPENIMLSRENDLNSVKIIDFGLSAQNFDKLYNNDYCGTLIYMAPELIEKKLYCISVDIWSIGVLMFVLLNKGRHPFYVKGDSKKQIANKIENGKIKYFEKISPMAKHLISKLLEPNPSWRYTASQAIKHPWITRDINDVPPLTINELLARSNSKKIMKDLFNTCLFLNYCSKMDKFKFLTIKRYDRKCNNINKIREIKLNKKREKCLDVISIAESEKNNELCREKIEQSIYNRLKARNTMNTIYCQIRGKHKFYTTREKFSSEKKENKYNKKNGEFRALNLLKKYEMNKIVPNNLNFQCRGSSSVNLTKINIKKSYNYIHKFTQTRNSTKLKKSYTLITDKYNSTSKTKKINDDICNEKNNEEKKYKSTKDICQFEKPKDLYEYLSSKKMINNFPKLVNAKSINLFKRNSQISLNNIENINLIPTILPNLGRIGKRKEIDKSRIFMKLRILKK